MTRKDRNDLSQARIICAALQEFGEKSYAEASINTICNYDGVSKGNVYHYFADKDTLYLTCAQACFDEIIRYLTANLPLAGKGVDCDLRTYFNVRQRFFEDNPHYRKFFYQISSTPPLHLQKAVEEIRTPFDRFNTASLSAILKQAKLRPGITLAEVAEVHMALQNALLRSEHMQELSAANSEAREELSLHWMDILLHGVIERT